MTRDGYSNMVFFPEDFPWKNKSLKEMLGEKFLRVGICSAVEQDKETANCSSKKSNKSRREMLGEEFLNESCSTVEQENEMDTCSSKKSQQAVLTRKQNDNHVPRLCAM